MGVHYMIGIFVGYCSSDENNTNTVEEEEDNDIYNFESIGIKCRNISNSYEDFELLEKHGLALMLHTPITEWQWVNTGIPSEYPGYDVPRLHYYVKKDYYENECTQVKQSFDLVEFSSKFPTIKIKKELYENWLKENKQVKVYKIGYFSF